MPAPDLETALREACEQIGLPEYYRDCVRPIVHAPRSQWPQCCGGGCEPCMGTLTAVAELVLLRLERDK